ncbi:MAG TPA: AraC family transcriptional regulator [Candidatus Methylacidiphilales bacterium]
MVAKKSEVWREDAAYPRSLIRVGHYYQDPGCDPLWETVRFGRERLELLTGGRGWLKVEGEMVEVTAGALVWNVEGDTTISKSDWENPYRCLAVDFAVPYLKGIRRAPRLAWWRDEEEVGRFITEAVRASVDDRVDRTALLAYVYGRLLFQSRLWARTQTDDREALPEPLAKAVALVERGEDGQWLKLGAIAKRVGWSVPYLHETFRARLGTTPHEAGLRARMQLARERLAATDHPVKRIAADCGFGSDAAFCHAFRTRVGMTPLKYRRAATSARGA